MHRQKLRFYHLFICGWVVLASISFYFYRESTRAANDLMRTAKSVTGLVVASSFTPKGHLRSVDLTIPLTHGVTQCHTFMDESLDDVNARTWPKVELYVSEEYSPPVPLECWTATSIRNEASEPVWRSLYYSTCIGLFGSILLNYLLVRIPFGSRGQSLKERWDRE